MEALTKPRITRGNDKDGTQENTTILCNQNTKEDEKTGSKAPLCNESFSATACKTP